MGVCAYRVECTLTDVYQKKFEKERDGLEKLVGEYQQKRSDLSRKDFVEWWKGRFDDLDQLVKTNLVYEELRLSFTSQDQEFYNDDQLDELARSRMQGKKVRLAGGNIMNWTDYALAIVRDLRLPDDEPQSYTVDSPPDSLFPTSDPINDCFVPAHIARILSRIQRPKGRKKAD